jgi:hypothetical protein
MKLAALLIAHVIFVVRSRWRLIVTTLFIVSQTAALLSILRSSQPPAEQADASLAGTFINANGTMPAEWQAGGPAGPGWFDDDSGAWQAVVADASAMVGIRGKTVAFQNEVNNNDAGPSDGAAPFNINWTSGQKQVVFLTGNATFTFTAPPGPSNITLRLIQSGAGSNLVTWPATVKWATSTPPTLSTAVNAIDICSFYWNGTNYFGVCSLNFGWNVDLDLPSRYAANDNAWRMVAN